MHTKRNFGLDLLRALAISMVFLSHGVSAFEALGVGVDLFFVLSGFLIGRIYLRAQADAHQPPGTFSLWAFWSARWLRTLPPYFVAVGLFALAERHFHNNPVRPSYLLFLQNYLGIAGFGPSWSLCVEEHFYLALPLLGWMALRRRGRHRLLWLLPAMALIPQVVRGVLASGPGLNGDWYWKTHLHCEGLILGVWLAYVFVDKRLLWEKLRAPAIVAAILPIGLLAYQAAVPNQPLAFRATVFLGYAVGYAGWLRLLYDLRWQPRSTLGRATAAAIHAVALGSYSIYLVHTLLLSDVRLLVDGWPRGLLKSGTILLSTLVGAAIFYFAVERPSIWFRDRLLTPGPGRR